MSNEGVLMKIGTTKKRILTIRKLYLIFGRIMRKEDKENLTITGHLETREAVGSLTNLREWITKGQMLLRPTEDRKLQKDMIGYVPRDDNYIKRSL